MSADKGNNSSCSEFNIFLFPIVIKIKLVPGFIPTDVIAFEI